MCDPERWEERWEDAGFSSRYSLIFFFLPLRVKEGKRSGGGGGGGGGDIDGRDGESGREKDGRKRRM